MKDILFDIVSHVTALGNSPEVRVIGTSTKTIIDSIAESKVVSMSAILKTPVPELEGSFGLPNLEILRLHLKNPEYKEDAKISVIRTVKNDIEYINGIMFQNKTDDFKNEYRFKAINLVNDKLKDIDTTTYNWDVSFPLNQHTLNRMKSQSYAHPGLKAFRLFNEGNDLRISFTDEESNIGIFTFQSDVIGKLNTTYLWPINDVLSILQLGGDININISDKGKMQIVVDSGLAVYTYLINSYSTGLK